MTHITPDVLFNHDSGSGRTRKNEDGSFLAYDLRDATVGGMLAVRSGKDVHILVKEEAGEYEDARQNWRLLAERELGSAVKLVLLEHKFGTSFLTHGIVLKQGLELGVVERDATEHSSMKSLGVIAGIAYATAATEADEFSADLQLV